MIPSIVVVVYIIAVMITNKKTPGAYWYEETSGFTELCKSLISFTSVILGIYGVVVPIALGKINTDFSVTFWNLINRERFAADVKRILISGILNILLCSLLIIRDVMTFYIITSLICLAIWTLLFFMISSYRFISIFMALIVQNQQSSNYRNSSKDDLSEKEVDDLNKIKKL